MQRVIVALGLVTAAVVTHDAGACSCAGPQASLVSPEHVEDAPLNTRVRLELPSNGVEGATMIFRAHGTTTNVKTTERKMPLGSVNIVELIPAAPLAPETRYEIGFTDPSKHPATHILGSFKTGTAADNTAPKIDKIGAVEAVKPSQMYGGGSCSVSGPWVQVSDLTSSDGARNATEVNYAIWVADAAGVIDEKKTPTAIFKNTWSTLSLGPSSICDPHTFPYPKAGGSMTIGIAAVDLAGNISAVKRATVNLSAPKAMP